MSPFFASGGQSIGASASASVLPMSIQGCFPLGLTSLSSLLSKGLSGVFSRTTVWKHQFFSTNFFMVQFSHMYTTARRTIALTVQTLVSKVMSLIFNTMARLVMAFPPRGSGEAWLSHVWLFATPWTVQSMEFSRQEYWSGYTFPSPGNLPKPGIKPWSPVLQTHSLPAEPPGMPSKEQFSSVQLSHSVISNSLWPHGLQHARLLCPLPTPGAYSNSGPSSWCWHLILCCPLLLLLSIIPSNRVFSKESVLWIRYPNYWVFSFSISLSNEYSGPISFRMDWLDLLAVQGTFKNLLQHHSSKASVLRCSAFFIVQLSYPYMTTGKTKAFLTIWTSVDKVMSLLFNMLYRLVITFLPRSKCLLISWLQSPSAVILEPPKIKSVIVSIVSPYICHEVMGPDALILVFSLLSFKPTFSLSSFTLTKRFFSSSLLSAIRVVSSAYLRLLIFLPAILIPACASSSPAFLMIYSAYKLNRQGDNIQPWRTPFPIWNQSVFPCPVLTVASWPTGCWSWADDGSKPVLLEDGGTQPRVPGTPDPSVHGPNLQVTGRTWTFWPTQHTTWQVFRFSLTVSAICQCKLLSFPK